MANIYSWTIKQMDIIPNFNGFTNFVTRIYWDYNGINENNTSNTITGYVEFNNRSSDPYVEYGNITEEEVIGWVETHTNVSELQNIISQKIYNIENPPIVNLPFPWIPSPTPTPTSSETPTPTPTPNETPTQTPTISVTPSITPSVELIDVTPEPTPT